MLPPTVWVLQLVEILDQPAGHDGNGLTGPFTHALAPVLLLRQVISARASCPSNNPTIANAEIESDLTNARTLPIAFLLEFSGDAAGKAGKRGALLARHF
jgi:hypothetical protein